jgi:uncharacterized membrane protein
MQRSTSRNLYLIGLVLSIIGAVLYFLAAAQSLNTDGTVNVSSTSATLALVGIVALIVGGIFSVIAWIGALIKTAQLGQWLWFVLVLLLSGTVIMMLVYIFAGPTKPANSGQMA